MKCKRLDVYVGLGNQNNDNREDLDAARNRFASFFNDKEIGFSIIDQVGGYVLENGKYIIENSLRITISGFFENDDIAKFIGAIKKAYNQETVLVNLVNIDMEYI